MEFVNENLILVSLAIVVFLLAIFNELKIKEGNICGLTPMQAVKLINQNAVVFDLRSQEAFDKKHLLGSKNVSAAELATKTKGIKHPLLIVCETGGASKKGSLALRQNNVEQAFYIKGGLNEWEKASLPITSE